MALDARTDRSHSLSQKLWWLILGRLAAAILIFAAHAWVQGTRQPWSRTFSALLFMTGLTALYLLARRFSSTLVFQARIQFIVDIVLVTWLVWDTDVIHSPYVALYIVIIAVSSLFLGPRDAIVTSVGCAVA